MRRILYTGLIFIFLLLSACELKDPSLNETNTLQNHGQNEPVIVKDTVFGFAYTDEAKMNPLTTKNKINLELFGLVYEGLFEIDEKFEPVNILCSDYEINGNTYRFKLKDGVTFSDGSPLRASDVVFSLRLAMQPESYYASRLTNIANIKADGSTAVLVTVNRYTGNLPRLLDVPIIKSGSDASEIALGTGGYVLTTNERGEYQLIAREGWHMGKSLPYSRIELTKAASADELVFAFESRDIDVLSVDPTSSDALQFRGEYEQREYQTTIFQYLGFNMSKPALKDALVRRAIARAIDRDATVSQDFAQLADVTCLPMHPDSPAYDTESADKLSFSLENSLSLLISAGYSDSDGDGKLENQSGGELSLRLLVNSDNKSRVALAQRICTDLAKIGVTASVDEKAWEDYLSALYAGNFDLYLAEVNLSADFDVSRLIRTGGALNYGRYSSTDTDACLDAFNAATLRKSDEALRFYNNFVLQVPIVPISFKKHSHMTHLGAFENISFTQRNIFYRFYNWRPVR